MGGKKERGLKVISDCYRGRLNFFIVQEIDGEVYQ